MAGGGKFDQPVMVASHSGEHRSPPKQKAQDTSSHLPPVYRQRRASATAIIAVASMLLNCIFMGILIFRKAPYGTAVASSEGAEEDKVEEIPSDPCYSADSIENICYQRQLKRADVTFKRHMWKRAQFSGTKKEVAEPLPFEVQSHWDSTRGSNWMLVEYMMLPKYPCAELERLGDWGEGGKWLCMTPFHDRTRIPVVYSIGSNGETSFEKDIFRALGSKSFTFDPTVQPATAEDLRKLSYLHFYATGLKGASGSKDQASTLGSSSHYEVEGSSFKPALKTIEEMMEELNHTFVDVFKIDCEGCEIDFVANLHRYMTRMEPIFGQILMEIHHVDNSFVESKLLKRLHVLGYRLFMLEPNFYNAKACYEIALIHESLVKPAP